jgi:hypothetical protein
MGYAILTCVYSEGVRPPDIKIVKPVNSSSDIDSLLIQDLAEYLHILNIGQYAEQLADAQIDGILLKELDEQLFLFPGCELSRQLI